jgi:hypothetical protein
MKKLIFSFLFLVWGIIEPQVGESLIIASSPFTQTSVFISQVNERSRISRVDNGDKFDPSKKDSLTISKDELRALLMRNDTISIARWQELKEKRLLPTQNYFSKDMPLVPLPDLVIGNNNTSNNSLLIPLDSSFSVVPFTNGLPPEYRNDDGSSPLIQLPFIFNFYGQQYTSVYINNNGTISFDEPYWQYTPTGFPVAGFPMIAAFWADVDTRNPNSGLVYYKVERNRLVIIWDKVGYFNSKADKFNTFELIITDGTDPLIGLGRNVCFSYGDMQWTTGDASDGSNGFGGVPATVGINKGDGVNFALLGRFDHEGTDYDGPGGNNDGVSYLDNKFFAFNVAFVGELPDFYITSDDISLSPMGNFYQISAVVRNLGASANSVEVVFIEHNLENNRQVRIGQTIIPSISSQDQVLVTVNYVPSSAYCEIIIRIDPFNRIQEFNEQNNSASKNFSFEKPIITSVTAKYDGDPDPEIFGRYLSGLNGTINTFYATVNGNVSKVEFTLNDKTIIDDNPSDGWSADFDMGSLSPGLHNLIVKAYSDLNIASTPMVKKIDVASLPPWVTLNFRPNDFYDVQISQTYITFNLNLGNILNYVALINDDVMFIPKDSIEGKSKLWLKFSIPLDATLNWQIGGGFSFEQKIFGKKFENEVDVTLLLNNDRSINSILLSFEGGKTKLFGLSLAKKYPLPVPGLNAVISGEIDVTTNLKIYIIAGMVNNQLRFITTPDSNKSRISPGIDLEFNLITGLEILFGLLSGQLVLSPQFNFNITATYTNYPVNEGLRISASGEGQVGWRVVGTAFWGHFESVLYEGTFGPWTIFRGSRPSLAYSKFKKLEYYNFVQLPTILPLPSIATDPYGNIMVVWLEKENPSSPPQIFYSFKSVDGTFSSPQPLISNSFYKSDPKIIFNPDGTANAVWVQNSQTESFLETNPTLSDILRYQDIYYSFWDKTRWSTPALVTNEIAGEEKSDGVPTIIVSPDNSEKIILWTRNVLNNSLQRTGLEIFYAKIDSSGNISSPLPLTSNNYADLMVRGCYFDNKKALAIWIRDEDGDPETAYDNEIYYSRWNNGNWENPSRLTNNFNQEKDLSITSLRDGRAIAVWVEIETLEDSTLRYYLKSAIYDHTTNSWSVPEIIYTSEHFIETPIVNVDPRNIATVTWRGYYENINGDILIALRDFRNPASAWTSPKPITNDELIDWMIATAIDASSNQYFVHLKSSTESISGKIVHKPNFYGELTLTAKGIKSNGQISDNLNFNSYLIAADLVIDSISVIDSTIRENEISNLFIHIRNIGGISSESTIVRVYNGNPLEVGTQVGSDITLPSISSDSSIVLQFPFLFQNVNNIYVYIDPDSIIREQSRLNNIVGRTITLLPDLAIKNININFSTTPSINQTGNVTVIVKNNGQRSVDSVTIQFLEKLDEPSAVAHEWLRIQLRHLKPDSIYELSVPYTVVHGGRTIIYANIDPDNTIAELSKMNNKDSTILKVLPDIRLDTLWFNSVSKNLIAVISNIGGDTAKEFDISFYNGDPLLQGILIGTIHKSFLNPNTSDTILLPYIPPSGLSNIYCWIDPNKSLQELSIENNKTYVSFITQGMVDLHPISISNDSFYPIGLQFPIPFVISNIGSSGANSIEYQIIVKKMPSGTDSLLATRIIPILNPQETYLDTLWWTFEDTSLIEFKIVVDPFNAIVEANETNNIITGQSRGYINTPPKIISTPVTDAYEGSIYSYKIVAIDADSIYGDYLRYDIKKPEWLIFDSTNHTIWGTPQRQNVGFDSIFIKVTDKGFASDSQSFVLIVHTSTQWSIKISSKVDSLSDLNNFAAVHSQASDSLDPYDIPKPPSPNSNYVYLYFPHPEWGGILGPNYSKDTRRARDLTNETIEWLFNVKTDQAGKNVILEFNPDSLFPSNYTIVLYDLDAGTRKVLSQSDNTYTYNSGSGGERHFKLVVGGLFKTRNFQAGWNLVGIPLSIDSTLSSMFSDDVSTFYIYTYTFKEGYKIDTTFTLGKGFWLGLVDSAVVDFSGIPVKDTISTNLDKYWNIISIPYLTPITKGNIFVERSGVKIPFDSAVSSGWISSALFGYDPRTKSYYLSDTLEPWLGYWFATLKDSLKLIYTPSSTAPSPKVIFADVKSDDRNWNVILSARLGDVLDKLAFFGVRDGASDGIDRFDYPKPPLPPGEKAIQVYFYHPEWNFELGPYFASDIRASFGDVKSWKFYVRCLSGGEVKLSWDLSQVPGRFNFTLFDVSSGRVVNMRSVSEYVYNAVNNETREFRIDAVTGVSEENTIPKSYALYQNYPNPFNPSTTIEFDIPERTNVKLIIYDILGREVKKLIDKELDPGKYKVNFDAKDLSSGVYFYTLRTPKFTKTDKMLLIK